MDKKITNEEYFAKASNLISWIEATSTDIESVNDLRRSMVRAIDQYMLTDKSMPWGNINRNEMSKYFGIATSGWTMPIDPELRRWMKKVDSKLDNIEYRLGNVEHRLDEVDSRLDDMEYRLDDIEYRLGKIDFRLDKLDIATNKINIRLDELTLYISSLESSLEDGLDNMQSEIFGLQGSIDELRPLIYSASRRVAVLEKNGGDTCLSDCNKPSPKQGVHGNHKYNINDGSINKHDDWFG